MAEASADPSPVVAGFFVPGVPVTQGSTKAFVSPKTGRAIITSTSGADLKHWRAMVAIFAKRKRIPMADDGPVMLEVRFFLPRPKKGKRPYPSVRPDLDKLLRAVGDALTGIAYRDDSQIVDVICSKRYDAKPGVFIRVASVT